MPAINLRQADVPEGATTIPQQPGTAPGLICPVGEKVIYAVPGVPNEMQTMLVGTILPDLKRRTGFKGIIKSRVLKTWGHSESGLAELLGERIKTLDSTGSATLAFQASGIEGIKVRITVKTDDEASAVMILDDEESVLRRILGKYVFAVDDETMESVVISGLRNNGLSLAVAEISSGGLVSSRLSAIETSGKVFLGGIVPVSGRIRESLLGVPGDVIGSERAAAAMANAARETLGADVGIATTSFFDLPNTGQLPPGTTFLGLSTADGTDVDQVHLPGDRERIRQYSVISLLNFLRLKLLV